MHDLYDEAVESLAIEELCRQSFGLVITVKQIIALDTPTSKDTRTTVFQDAKHTIYALCMSSSPLVLADVKNIIDSMGMVADFYLPPYGDSNYFTSFGEQTFRSVYPGRRLQTGNDTAYYQTLAPYSPALVRISKVKGEIRQYIAPTQRWQRAKEWSYERLQIQHL